MDNLHFLRPEWFYALIPLAMLMFYTFSRSAKSFSWQKICDEKLLPHILIGTSRKQSRLPFFSTIIATLLCVIAAAGPVWKKLPTPVFRDQSSLVVAMDLSQSMDASDIKPTRLARAKLKLIDILQHRKGGQTALIVYAANAFTVTPLTTDTATIENLTSALETTMMPAQGSNATAAIKLANSLLNQSGSTEGDVLLITDGVSKRDFTAITDLTKKRHRLSILGVGTKDGGPIALDGGFLQDNSGAIVIPKLDNQLLNQAALTGRGLYVSMQTDDDDIKSLSRLFNSEQIKPDSVETELTADLWHEEGPWLLLVVLPIVALLSRRGLLVLFAVLLLPLPQPTYAESGDSLWLNNEQKAQSYFERGEHEKAAALFKDELWKASAYYRMGDYEKALDIIEQTDQSTNSDVLYNKANTLARLQRYEEALESYDEAIEKDPNNEDARYNRELVKKKLEEQQQSQQQDNQNQDNEQNKDDKDSEENKKDQQSSEKQGDKKNQDQSQQADQGEQDEANDNLDKAESNPQQKSADARDNEDKKQSKAQDEKSQQENEQQDEMDKQEQLSQLEQEQLTESSEQKKATEQWLKRIVDDPGGLLRRKFEYQYKNMPGQKRSQQPW